MERGIKMLEIGTLVEIKRTRESEEAEKLAIIKLDQSRQIVILENQQTGEKVQMTYTYFSEMTGIELDSRQILHG